MLTPVRITQEAVAKFPRRVLFAVLLAYAVPGLFGRDPWRLDDAVGFGVMWTMAQGNAHDWLVLNVAGAPFVEEGPLFFWIGAVLMKAFGWRIHADELARVATLLMQGLAGACIWYTAYLLGRRPEAQPQKFAFGGHADSKDYGRVLGDSALLFAVATLGLLMRAHESSAQIAHFAFVCLALFALVRWLDRPFQGAAQFGAGVAGLVLSSNFNAAVIPVVTLVAVLALAREWRRPVLRTGWLALVIAIAPIAGWWWALGEQPDGDAFRRAWLEAAAPALWIAHPHTWLYYLRNLTWFVWPVWPIAGIALWTWRSHVRAPHIALPVAGLVGSAAFLAIGHAPGDTAMMLVVPPMLTLAAFGLPALRRGAANLIDWFALLAFSLFGATIWVCWIIAMTHTPAAIANNFTKLVPGFAFSFAPISVLLAVVVTIGWVRAVRWRIVERPNVLWRSTVLSSSGVAFVWMLLVALALPYADYLKTYRVVSADLAKRIPRDACVFADPVGLAQRASFAYFDGMRFGGDACGWLLRHRGVNDVLPPIDDNLWRLVWEGRRPGDRRERILLYRRAEVAAR